jgi:hypothetical protein
MHLCDLLFLVKKEVADCWHVGGPGYLHMHDIHRDLQDSYFFAPVKVDSSCLQLLNNLAWVAPAVWPQHTALYAAAMAASAAKGVMTRCCQLCAAHLGCMHVVFTLFLSVYAVIASATTGMHSVQLLLW